MKTNVVFFHGFLGRPTDWLPIIKKLEEALGEVKALPIDLNVSVLGQKQIVEAAEHFVRMQNDFLNDWVAVGYSMGGRFLAQTLPFWKNKPKKIVFVSANLQFNPKEGKARMEVDQVWARRFLSESFYTVIGDWNNLPVFSGSEQEPERFEEEYDKRILADQLVNWSPVVQAQIDVSSFNCLHISGDRDLKYVELLRKYPKEIVRILHDSGHRVIFDQPYLLADTIGEFFKELP